jgi:PPOX class probable F420-dependent enzyme
MITIRSGKKIISLGDFIMQNMSTEEYRSFLMDTVRTGKLATVRADGRPHVVPIWYVLDADDLVFNTWHTSIKAKNMRHDARVAISIDEVKPLYSFVMIEGDAELSELSPEELLPWTTQIARRYMGNDLAEQFGKRNAVVGELLVRVKVSKIIAKKGVSD